MKILVINTLYQPYQVGGAEKSVKLLAEYFCTKGDSVYVLTLMDEDLPSEESVNHVNVIRVVLGNIYWPFRENLNNSSIRKLLWHLIDIFNFKSAYQAYLVMKKLNPDVLVTNNISGFSVSVWMSACFLNMPIVHVVRDYYLLNPDTVTPSAKGVLINVFLLPFKIVKRFASLKIKNVVFISRYINDIHISHNFFKNAHHSVIYNSVEQIQCLPRNSHAFRFGFLGRIERNKGIEVLLEAFDSLNSLDNKFSLHVAGKSKDSYSDYLKNNFKNSNTQWHGFLDAKSFFEKIDFLVVPSVWPEPLGRVVLESYSFGVPVIVSDSGGLPEIVEHNKTGLIFSSGISIELKECIQKITKLDYEQLSNNCLHYVEKFSFTHIGDKYHKLLTDIIDK